MITAPRHICVCGGGHIAHSLLAVFSMRGDVDCLTRQPERWKDRLKFSQGASRTFYRCPHAIHATSDPAVIEKAELIVIALPRFAIVPELEKIGPWLHSGQTVCFIPAPAGLDAILKEDRWRGIEWLAFQRVPFVARIASYGESAWFSECRTSHKLATSVPGHRPLWSHYFEGLFGGGVSWLSSFLLFTFSNSNPLLHPSRLVCLFKDWRPGVIYPRIPAFYGEWGEESSVLYHAADLEMMEICRHYPEIDLEVDYEDVLHHYDSTTCAEMTRKIRSIPSLKRIQSPMVAVPGGYVPDLWSRYFTEDVPYGTKIIQDYARRVGVPTPVIDSLITGVERISGYGGLSSMPF